MQVELLLELEGELEAALGILDQARHLPEDRLLLARVGPERRGVHHVLALGQHAQADLLIMPAGALLHLAHAAALARDEQMQRPRSARRAPAWARDRRRGPPPPTACAGCPSARRSRRPRRPRCRRGGASSRARRERRGSPRGWPSRPCSPTRTCRRRRGPRPSAARAAGGRPASRRSARGDCGLPVPRGGGCFDTFGPPRIPCLLRAGTRRVGLGNYSRGPG